MQKYKELVYSHKIFFIINIILVLKNFLPVILPLSWLPNYEQTNNLSKDINLWKTYFLALFYYAKHIKNKEGIPSIFSMRKHRCIEINRWNKYL